MENKEISCLVNRYFKQIEVESADEEEFAELDIIVPLKMLQEYQKIKKSRKKFPDGEQFWKETNLAKKLYEYDRRRLEKWRYPEAFEETLDLLNLTDNVNIQFQPIISPKNKVRLYIEEYD
jgi:hypothetical protein